MKQGTPTHCLRKPEAGLNSLKPSTAENREAGESRSMVKIMSLFAESTSSSAAAKVEQN